MVVITELSPGSSSSSSTRHQDHTYIYDVFLSFRGVDTRDRFTDHLYDALLDAGIINTFLDDAEIEIGEPLKPELESAIKSSRASIIVLSKNYASSTWCLDELELILEQKKFFNQIVIPIFYDVEPTDVRKQQNSFGEAMAKHKQRMEREKDAEKRSQLAQKMKSWKNALTQIADLKGKHTKGRKETEFIKEVVTDIHRRLGVLLSKTMPRPIGRDNDIKFITSWLMDGSCHTADILSVVGMSGIGKTSLARYVFGLYSGKFHKSSFIEGINTRCKEKFNGLLDLQKQLHGDISKKLPLQVNDVYVYTSKIENALARKRVFIVLDGIGSVDELNALLGNKGLHPGSKIIITTNDASLTERCAFFNLQVQPKHKKLSLNGLDNPDSLKLFCIHAFKSHKPKEGYEEVSGKLVKYCDGHPLALQVLGISLQNQVVEYWEDSIRVLKKELHSNIKRALRMSFDALPYDNDKELFKHISCFFVGVDRDVIEIILQACDINTRSGIKNLIDRCLLIKCGNQLWMHSLIQEMGRDLVRQESPDKPWERSRVWCHEESFKMLEQEKGTNNLVGLALDMRKLEKEKLSGSLQPKTDALSKMDNLKLLQLNHVKLNGSYKNISKELRWLCMRGSHFKSIPSELSLENLVALDMSHSNIESFDMSYSISQQFMSRLKVLTASSSKEKRLLRSLKLLDLSFCERLHNIGGFLELPALERLIVKNCISLTEVCESVEQCVELVHMDLRNCYKLKKLRVLGKLKKIRTLLLDGCNSKESQMETRAMNLLAIMKARPHDLKVIFATSLPSSLRVLSLRNNNLSNESFPTDFKYISMLEELYLDYNPIVSMPNCVRTLSRLKILSMWDCDEMISIEHPPPTLTSLYFGDNVRKFKFHPELSPRKRVQWRFPILPFPYEIVGTVKVEPMAGVEEKVLKILGWTDLDFNKKMPSRSITFRHRSKCECYMCYEFGIFSTLYYGNEMPNWIRCRSKGPSISFTNPSSSKNLRGLNFCYVYDNSTRLPEIVINNTTKSQIWTYHHYIGDCDLDGQCICFLSHWMFGPNEMKGGDLVTITVRGYCGLLDFSGKYVKECGIRLVYEEGTNEEEDVLGYYKSWNHIIGGDLSAFQTTTGEYTLHHRSFEWFPAIHTRTESSIFLAESADSKASKRRRTDGWVNLKHSQKRIKSDDGGRFQHPAALF